MANEIPRDEAAKAAAVVEALRELLRPLLEKPPEGPTCAFQARVPGGEECE